jgi:hypothetical protein
VDAARGSSDTRTVSGGSTRNQRDEEHCQDRNENPEEHYRGLYHFHLPSSSY